MDHIIKVRKRIKNKKEANIEKIKKENEEIFVRQLNEIKEKAKIEKALKLNT